MARYLDPKNDVVFRRIFDERPDLFIDLLNSLLPLEKGRKIESVEYIPPEYPSTYKASAAHACCKDNFGKHFLVATEVFWSEMFERHLIHNVARTLLRPVKIKGKEGGSFLSIYGLGLINEAFDDKTTDYHHVFRITDSNNYNYEMRTMQFVLVELPKFKPSAKPEHERTNLWLRFLTEIKDQSRKAPEDLLVDANIRDAIELCEESHYTDGELGAYERCWDTIWLNHCYEAAKLMEIWKERIMRSDEKATEIKKVVLEMLKKGFDIGEISETTGLTSNEIEELKKEKHSQQ